MGETSRSGGRILLAGRSSLLASGCFHELLSRSGDHKVDGLLLVAVEGLRRDRLASLTKRLLLVLELAGLLNEGARRAERADQGVLDGVAADAVALTRLEARDALHRGLADAGELWREGVQPAPETDVLRLGDRCGCKGGQP